MKHGVTIPVRLRCDWSRGACSALAVVKVRGAGFEYVYCERHAVKVAEQVEHSTFATALWRFAPDPRGGESVPMGGLAPLDFVSFMRARDVRDRNRRAVMGRGRWKWVAD